MLSRSGFLALLGLAAWVLGHAAALAQITPGAVRSTLPGPAVAPVRPDTKPKLVRPIRPNIPDTGPKILVNEFVLSGNVAISTEQLQAQLKPFTGQRISLLGIYDVADALTEYYREQGFSVASVNVPAQKVSAGTVKLVVLEGRIGKVEVTGNEKYSFDFIRERVHELKPGTYIKGDVLRRNMHNLTKLPGVSATAVVQPGAAVGDSDVVVKVDENPYDVVIRADNHGRDSIGRSRAQADLFVYNPTGVGDQLNLSGLVSEGLGIKYAALGYSQPIGVNGTRWEISMSRHLYEVRSGLSALRLSGDGATADVGVRIPLVSTPEENLTFGIWYSHTESNSNDGTGGATSVSRDKLNEISTGLNFDRTYASGAFSAASLRYSTNFKRNTDFDRADVTTDNAQLGKFEVSLSHSRPFIGNWLLLGRLNGVLSLGPLMEIERFRIGGPTSVRAFPSATEAGDAGYQFTLEFQRPFAIAVGVPVVFKTFFDTGLVYRMPEPRELSGESASTSLSALGAGLRMSYAKNYTLDLEVARPLSAHDTESVFDGGQFWATFSALF